MSGSRKQPSLAKCDESVAVSRAIQRTVAAPDGQHGFSDNAKYKRPACYEPIMERGRDAGGRWRQLRDARLGSELLWLSIYIERDRRTAVNQIGACMRNCEPMCGTARRPRHAVFLTQKKTV